MSEMRKWQIEDAKLGDQFKIDLLAVLGFDDHPKGATLFRLAWEYGHSSGYAEVLRYADELSELL